MAALAWPLFLSPALADIKVGERQNGLSINEERYLRLYEKAHDAFGAATVGANLVDDGTGQHKPYNLPEALVAEKASVLERWLNPPEPEPTLITEAPVESTEASVGQSYAASSSGVSNSTVMCESGGDYSIDTGNGYYGGYQFDSATWDAYGDPAYGEANEAPPAVQDAAAASVPYDAWPNC